MVAGSTDPTHLRQQAPGDLEGTDGNRCDICGTSCTHMDDRVFGFGWPALKICSGSSALSRLMRLLNWCISLSKKWNDEIEEVVV